MSSCARWSSLIDPHVQKGRQWLHSHKRATGITLLERSPPRQVSLHSNADYRVPPPAAATPTTICVPPSNWISCLAPSRMLEA